MWVPWDGRHHHHHHHQRQPNNIIKTSTSVASLCSKWLLMWVPSGCTAAVMPMATWCVVSAEATSKSCQIRTNRSFGWMRVTLMSFCIIASITAAISLKHQKAELSDRFTGTILKKTILTKTRGRHLTIRRAPPCLFLCGSPTRETEKTLLKTEHTFFQKVFFGPADPRDRKDTFEDRKYTFFKMCLFARPTHETEKTCLKTEKTLFRKSVFLPRRPARQKRHF